MSAVPIEDIPVEPPFGPQPQAIFRRRKDLVPRPRQVGARFSLEEIDDLQRAADAAGLTLTGYVAERAVACARGELHPLPASMLEQFRGLMDLQIQVRRVRDLLNQAVAKLNATGQPDMRLPLLAARIKELVRTAESLMGDMSEDVEAEHRRAARRRRRLGVPAPDRRTHGQKRAAQFAEQDAAEDARWAAEQEAKRQAQEERDAQWWADRIEGRS